MTATPAVAASLPALRLELDVLADIVEYVAIPIRGKGQA